MRLKVSSAKRRPFCLGLNELNHIWNLGMMSNYIIRYWISSLVSANIRNTRFKWILLIRGYIHALMNLIMKIYFYFVLCSGIEENNVVLSDVQQDMQGHPRPVSTQPKKPVVTKPINKPLPAQIPRKTETYMGSPEPAPRKTDDFLRSTESVFSPMPKKLAEKPQKKGFCGVTESMFVPRTADMDENCFGPPDKELIIGK